MKQSLISTVALLVVTGTTVPRETPPPDTTVPREDPPESPGEGPPDKKGPRERPDTTVPREEP
ncbi:MAG: hypothetical protein QOJ45_1198 [Verrucomicrobiota bacterium]|jgi:hypothetical protein